MFKIEALIWVSFSGALTFQPKSSIQEHRNELPNSYQTCAWYTWYMFPKQCEETKNQPSNSTSCSDNAHACWFLWCVHYIQDLKWRLHFQIGVAFEGLFWERNIILKGVEDFNLEHCPSTLGFIYTHFLWGFIDASVQESSPSLIILLVQRITWWYHNQYSGGHNLKVIDES